MLSACDTVYVVDPDESVHDALTTLLQSAGVRVVCYRTPEAFLSARTLQQTGNCCVLLEAALPSIGSLALIREVHAQAPEMPIIVLASTTDGDVAAQALKAGALDVIDKPLIGAHLFDRTLGVEANARYATSH